MFTKIGRERGFRAPNRAQYEQMLEPDGAFLIGSPETVAAKALRIHEELGGVARLALQMTNMRLAHDDLLRGMSCSGPASRRSSAGRSRPDPGQPSSAPLPERDDGGVRPHHHGERREPRPSGSGCRRPAAHGH